MNTQPKLVKLPPHIAHALEYLEYFKQGKKVQWRRQNINDTWKVPDGTIFSNSINWKSMDSFEFRLAPEPAYRPWTDDEARMMIGKVFRIKGKQQDVHCDSYINGFLGFRLLIDFNPIRALEALEWRNPNETTWHVCGVEVLK